MEKKETIEFMERIKSHYQEFIIDDFKIKEWHRELSNYDAEDVNKKLEEHLKSEVYGDQIPKLFFLTKYLIPSKAKGKTPHHIVECQLCGQSVFDDDYDSHYRRCSSSTTIVRDLKKYFNMTVDYQKLMFLGDDTFESVYVKYLNKMLDADNLPLIRKKVILRCLYPNVEIDINDLLKGL